MKRNQKLTRRQTLKLLGLGAAGAAMAACAAPPAAAPAAPAAPAESKPAEQPAAGGKLESGAGWTSGGEGEAREARDKRENKK
jgi:nitrous oxide reductase